MSILSKIPGMGGSGSGHGGSVHLSAPDAFIRIYAWLDQDTTNPASTDNNAVYTIHEDILSIETSKNKNTVGNWSVTLAPGKAYHSMIHPGDWITIHISDQELNKEESPVNKDINTSIKMLGIVRTIRRIESTSEQTGARSVRYVIAGEDFTSGFHIPLYVNPQLAGSDGGLTPESLIVSLFYGNKKVANNRIAPPQDSIRKILNLVYNGGETKDHPAILGHHFSVPSGLTKTLYGPHKALKNSGFLNLVERDFQSNLMGIADLMPDLGGEINTWSLIKSYCNPQVNEIYTDIFIDETSGKATPALVLRSIPFNKKESKPQPQCLSIKSGDKPGPKPGDKKLYVSKYISEAEIINLNHGKSDAERYNFWIVLPNINSPTVYKEVLADLVKSTTGGLKGLADTKSVARYGVRPYIDNSIYIIDAKKSGLGSSQGTASLFNSVVRDMWERSALFDNGIVQMVGSREHIPVGTNIKFSERKWLAHVEAVTNKYEVDTYTGKKKFFTSVAFVRLQGEDGEPLFLKKVKNPADYDPGVSTSNGFDEETGLASLGVKLPKF